MPIKGYNFPAVMFLLELDLQCTLAKWAFDHLEEGVPGWLKHASHSEIESRISPLEALSACTTLLSAVAMISKVLSPRSEPESANQRAESLRDLIGVDELPNLFDRKARNSWEHLDERLDVYFRGFESGSMKYGIVLTEDPPRDGTTAPRRLDPRSLQLCITSDILDLRACIRETETLKAKINDAFRRLQVERHELWDA